MGADEKKSISFSIRAWAAWDSDGDNICLSWSDTELPKVPTELRRRITAVGRRCLECGWFIVSRFQEQPKIVLSSRHGEFTRTFDLLRSIDESEDVSPADFSLSVHHALAGLLSIVTKNQGGHLAVAAGKDSLGFGFVEAAASLAESKTPVLLLYFDEVLPVFFNELIEQPTRPQAFAILLGRSTDPEPEKLEVVFSAINELPEASNDFSWNMLSGDLSGSWAGDRYRWGIRRHGRSDG